MSEKKIVEKTRKELRIYNKRTYEDLKKNFGEKYASTMQLAFWTYKISEEIDMSNPYSEENEKFVNLKNEALKVLVNNSEFVDFGFFNSPYGKVKFVKLCNKHSIDFRANWYYDGNDMNYHAINYYLANNLHECKHCKAEYIDNFYSLVNIIIGDENNKTILNLPYLTAKSVLNDEQIMLAKFSNESHQRESISMKEEFFKLRNDKNFVCLDIVKQLNSSLKNFKKVYEIE